MKLSLCAGLKNNLNAKTESQEETACDVPTFSVTVRYKVRQENGGKEIIRVVYPHPLC